MFRRAGRDLGLIHQVEAGWSLVELWSQPRVDTGKNGKVFSSHLFLIFCFGNGTDLCSLYLYHLQVWKRWNLHSKRRGKWVKASLMLVNRTRRRKKFLELAIWEVFYRRKRGLMNVDKQHVLQQLCSVSVDFQQLEVSISLLKKT